MTTETCSICMDKSADFTVYCNHTFCKNCVNAWREKGNETCPVCRQNMFAGPTIPPENGQKMITASITLSDGRVVDIIGTAEALTFMQHQLHINVNM